MTDYNPDEGEDLLIADIGAEKSILAACMTSPEATLELVEMLAGPEDFARPAHQMMFWAMFDLAVGGSPTDVTTLGDELRKRGQLRKCGNLRYLSKVNGVFLTVHTARHHARIIAELAERRRLEAAATTLLQGTKDPQRPLSDLIDRITTDVTRAQHPDSHRTLGIADLDFVLLDDFLAIEDETVQYRVDRLWPVGGRVVVAAQYKAGKTTMRDNLVRALVDKTAFLDAFPVESPDGRVVIIDNELDAGMMRRWLRDQKIVNTNRVAVMALRGRVGLFDIMNRAVRARWADKLRALDTSVVVFDCLRPVLDALGLDENRDAGRFLVAFDALLDEAGASEAALIHHMGHGAGRSRGDSRILDWPDVTWRLLRKDTDDPASPRYFSAFGRDVDVPEGLLAYTPDQRHLSLTVGSRQDSAAEALVNAVVVTVTAAPGITQNNLCKSVVGDDHQIRIARDLAVARQLVHLHPGRNNSKGHFPGAVGCGAVGCTTPVGGVVSAVIEHHTTPPLTLDSSTAPHDDRRERVMLRG